jgi:hypothetical protein
MRHAEEIAQYALSELTIRRSCECGVKTNLEHFLNAKLAQRARALPRALQTEGRRIGLEEFPWMWLEHRHPQRNAQLDRGIRRAIDHGLMASVHAIEISERNRCAARIIRNC